jgi:glycosyltransferase involved in cell wall biosynthesis
VFSLVIPAYNEEKRIGNTLAQLTSVLKDQQILVVFDREDHTPEIVKNFPVELIHSDKRLGKGGSIKEGIRRSKGEIVAFLDADMPVTLQSLLKVLETSLHSDLVVTVRRFMGLPTTRSFLHNSFVNTTKVFFPSLRKFRDFQGGLKAMKRDKVAPLLDELIMNDWLFDINLIYSFMRRGYIVEEVEVPWNHKEEGSHVSRKLVKVIVMMFLSLLKLRTFYSPARWILDTRSYKSMESVLVNILR